MKEILLLLLLIFIVVVVLLFLGSGLKIGSGIFQVPLTPEKKAVLKQKYPTLTDEEIDALAIYEDIPTFGKRSEAYRFRLSSAGDKIYLEEKSLRGQPIAAEILWENQKGYYIATSDNREYFSNYWKIRPLNDSLKKLIPTSGFPKFDLSNISNEDVEALLISTIKKEHSPNSWWFEVAKRPPIKEITDDEKEFHGQDGYNTDISKYMVVINTNVEGEKPINVYCVNGYYFSNRYGFPSPSFQREFWDVFYEQYNPYRPEEDRVIWKPKGNLDPKNSGITDKSILHLFKNRLLCP